MSNKVIWIFNQYVTRYSESGGTRHLDFASEWASLGDDVHIFASGFHYNEHKEKVLTNNENEKTEIINNVTVHWIKIYPYEINNYKRFISMYSFYRNVLKYIYSNKELINPDIVIGSSVHLLSVYAAYKVSRKFKSKFIVEIRDLWPETLVQLGKISRIHPLYLFFHSLEIFLYKKADKIVTLLNKADEYISLYSKKKIVCIPNGFNYKKLKNFNFKETNSKKFKILYLGTIGLADDVITLLEASQKLKKYDNIEIKIIGDGIEKKNLLRFKDDNNLLNVSFHKPIPKEKVYEELDSCDVVWVGMPNNINLYKYGLSSNKIYDYMAMKKTIIISTPLESNIITDANCGISIQAENSDELFDAILYLYNLNKIDLNKYGESGNAFIQKYLTIEKLNNKWIEIFDEFYK